MSGLGPIRDVCIESLGHETATMVGVIDLFVVALLVMCLLARPLFGWAAYITIAILSFILRLANRPSFRLVPPDAPPFAPSVLFVLVAFFGSMAMVCYQEQHMAGRAAIVRRAVPRDSGPATAERSGHRSASARVASPTRLPQSGGSRPMPPARPGRAPAR